MTITAADQQAITRALSFLSRQLISVTTKSIPGLDRILTSEGKRQRPKLLFSIVHYSGIPINENIVQAACAVELVHLASLIHDDIMDKGTVRRGVKTVSAVEGPDIALLAGDYLLAQACTLATRIDVEYGQIIADTIAQMCIGQAEEITSRYNVARRPSDLLRAIEGKTASLFVAAAQLGGKLAGLDPAESKFLHNVANNYGIAYQLRDDIQDFFQTTGANHGKSASYDFAEGNYTLPILLALSDTDDLRIRDLLNQAGSPSQIFSVLDEKQCFYKSEKLAEQFVHEAIKSLGKLSNKQLSKVLFSDLSVVLNSKPKSKQFGYRKSD